MRSPAICAPCSPNSGSTDTIEIRYLPAPHHSRPERIVPAIREQLAADDDGERPLVFGYGDCGTGGHLDMLLDEIGERAARLPGDHCYEFMAGSDVFAALHEAEPGTFYLTDFLAKHFDALVWGSLGLDRHPELRDAYFGNYTPRRAALADRRPGDRGGGPQGGRDARARVRARPRRPRAVRRRRCRSASQRRVA